MDFLTAFLNSLPGAVGQGLIWGIMAMGVYITFRILDVADLTVDGSLATGGAVAALAISLGWNPWAALLAAVIAGMLAGFATGFFHTVCGIPAILAGILTQLALYSINLRIMAIGDTATTKATLAVSVDKYDLLVSARYIRDAALNNPLVLMTLLTAAVIVLLYWFFGTEMGASLRATGSNPNMARAQGINTDRSKVLGLVELPIAGLMDSLDAVTMSEKVHALEGAWAEIGCTMPSPFMTMALIPLACLPELRLTNRGLVDCTTFSFTSLEVEDTESK